MTRLTLSYKDRRQHTYFLTGSDWQIGSHPDCQIRIDKPGILPIHARLKYTDGRYHLTAESGAGMLRMNHGEVDEHTLHDGDIIYLGDCSLMFTADAPVTGKHGSSRPARAWLQVLNGAHRGRTIQLENPVTRFGSAGDLTAMISRRADGYYLSHLEGDEIPQVNQTAINDTTWPLKQGDTIRMGKLSFGFFIGHESRGSRHEPADAGQRQFTRVSLHQPVSIASDEARWDTRLLDLSLSGALLKHPAGWTGKTGDRFTLRLQLADLSYLEVGAQVRQINADRLGMAFTDLDEAVRDGIRGLVEINLGDPALLQRELSEFL
jgi:pSer/pThr/pTyr-binding forkhead associated (FHA) protein